MSVHDGCAASFNDGKEVVDKVRMMGFASQPLPMAMEVECGNCGSNFEMINFESNCPDCDAVHAVTPCHAFDPANVKSAGVGY